MIWTIIIAVVIAAAIYVFYALQQARAPEAAENIVPVFQGPPPGSVPYVKGPTEPPPSTR